MAGKSPTVLSKANLIERGYFVEKVEYWHQFAKCRMDLLGFADLMALKAGEPPILVQTTTDTNRSARRKKIQASEKAKLWYSTGGKILLQTWGKKDRRWRLHEEEIGW